MHPLRKLRESGKPTAAQVSELLAENIVFNSPLLARSIEGREVIAAIFAQSSATRGSGSRVAFRRLNSGSEPETRQILRAAILGIGGHTGAVRVGARIMAHLEFSKEITT
jgi:hypothetical protein